MFASDLRRGLWFSQGIPVSSTNKIDLHDIIEILLKVALTTISHKPEVEHTNYVDRSSRISRTMLVFISKHFLHITNANYILVNYLMCCHSIFFYEYITIYTLGFFQYNFESLLFSVLKMVPVP